MTSNERVAKIVARMRSNPAGIRWADALAVAVFYFGDYRVKGSHHVFNTPWIGNPRVNLQRDGSKAKTYQVRQLLSAIDRLEAGQ